MNENIKMVLKIFGGLWVFSAVISIIFFATMKDEFFKDYKNAANDYVDAINNTADNKSTRSNKGMPDNWVLGDGTWIEKTRSSYYIDEFHEGLIYLNGMVVKNEPIDKVYKQFKDKVRGKYNNIKNEQDAGYQFINNEEEEYGMVVKNLWLKFNTPHNELSLQNFMNDIEENLDLTTDEDTFKKITFESAKEVLKVTPYLSDQEIRDWVKMSNLRVDKQYNAYWDACFEYYDNNLNKVAKKINSQLQKGKIETAKATAQTQDIYRISSGKISIPQLTCINTAYNDIDHPFNEKAMETIINTRAVCDSLIKLFSGESKYFAGTVDIEKNIPKTGMKNDDAIAVVFGIEKYKNVSDVTHANRDAHFMSEYFENTLGIPKSQIYMKTNEDVGKAEFDKIFSKGGWLSKRVKKKKSDIYFYYAGHGAPDIKENQAYLIPYDGDPNYASQTGYSIEKIHESLASLRANSTTVFLDACFSGANRESDMLLADARPVFIEVETAVSKNGTVFSAANGKQISSAWPEKKHGLFSYFLMKGLKGEADTNRDNKLTIKELGKYIDKNVSQTAGTLDREQNPVLDTVDKNRVLVQY